MKLESIQHLRAFAAVYVVLFHLGDKFSTSLFSEGWRGVSLFFAISGFIIAFVHGCDRGASGAAIYFIKRLVRIIPPYVPAFLLILSLFLLTGTGSDLHRDPVNILRNLFLIQTPSQSILGVAWTLVYEMYFYLMFGVFYIFFRMRAAVFIIIMLLPVVSAFFLQVEVSTDTFWSNKNILLFVGGAVIGFSQKHIPRLSIKWLYLPFLIVFLLSPLLNLPWYVFHLLILSCIIAAVSSEANSKILNYLGGASYSVYLVHIIWISILKNIIDSRTWIDFVFIFVVSMTLSLAYYELVEKRAAAWFFPKVRRFKRKLDGLPTA